MNILGQGPEYYHVIAQETGKVIPEGEPLVLFDRVIDTITAGKGGGIVNPCLIALIPQSTVERVTSIITQHFPHVMVYQGLPSGETVTKRWFEPLMTAILGTDDSKEHGGNVLQGFIDPIGAPWNDVTQALPPMMEFPVRNHVLVTFLTHVSTVEDPQTKPLDSILQDTIYMIENKPPIGKKKRVAIRRPLRSFRTMAPEIVEKTPSPLVSPLPLSVIPPSPKLVSAAPSPALVSAPPSSPWLSPMPPSAASTLIGSTTTTRKSSPSIIDWFSPQKPTAPSAVEHVASQTVETPPWQVMTRPMIDSCSVGSVEVNLPRRLRVRVPSFRST
jgi:hypothetical protein